MGTRDPRIDTYIDKAAPFAQPLEQAIEWIAEGKSRNWKYAKC